MKKHGSTPILIAIFFIGLAVLLYPSISNYVNSISASQAIACYDETAGRLDREKYETMLNQAKDYNAELAQKDTSFKNGEPTDSYYATLLDITNTGMIGYISIRKLGINLPIYHGTSEHALSYGTGHLEGSSLPVGGRDTHAIITGHRGLPNAMLFTDINRLEIGDKFTVAVLNEGLDYMVDQISIVEPDDIEKIGIVPGEDYITLITCTPYAVNTQRLLIRAKRTDSSNCVRVATDAVRVDPLVVAPVVAVPMIIILIIPLFFTSVIKKKKRRDLKSFITNRERGNI